MTTNCALYGILFSWTLFEYTFSKYLVTNCALIWFVLSWTVWICFWKSSFRECLWSQTVHCRKEQNINFHRRPKIWAWTFGHRSRSRSLKTFGFGRSLRPSVDLWYRLYTYWDIFVHSNNMSSLQDYLQVKLYLHVSIYQRQITFSSSLLDIL